LHPICLEGKEHLVITGDRPAAGDVLSAFDEYLRRVRGVSAGARRNYLRHASAFLEQAFAAGPAGVEEITVAHVAGFIAAAACRYQPRTVELAATALRSFFRFLRAAGLRADQLEDAVPMVPRRHGGLVRHLGPGRLGQLIASLDAGSPRGLRDRAIILCVARLGLRAGEVVALRLDDIDWRNATVRVRARKTGHGALLPLTAEVGMALAEYLRHGRPATTAREVFVQLRRGQRPGAAVTSSVVGHAVDYALGRAGIDAPGRGANLLRHSLATDLLAGGASLRQIADLLGHASLATTRIYAAVDVAALREVALPWPEAAW
jgi:site-specific recombinase XerD